jgi:hypothetical protein
MWSLLQLKEANINRKMWGTKVAKEVVEAARGWCPTQRRIGGGRSVNREGYYSRDDAVNCDDGDGIR